MERESTSNDIFNISDVIVEESQNLSSANEIKSRIKKNRSPPKGPTPKELVEKKREEKLRQEIKNLTFQPKLNHKNFENAQGSLLERIEMDVIKRKEQIKNPKSVEPECTFKPKLYPSKVRPSSAKIERPRPKAVVEEPTFKPNISERAKSIKRTTFGVSIGDRLYAQGIETKVKVDLLKLAVEQSEMQECTFAPKISESPFIDQNETNTSIARSGDFVQRMQQYAADVEIRKIEAKRTYDLEKQAETTFAPQLSHSPSDKSKGGDIFTKLATTKISSKIAASADQMKGNPSKQQRPSSTSRVKSNLVRNHNDYQC